ncbi:hypothetical protein GOP47_0013268 [Adiantum capillus-veneris]|uniref:Uncharacterized protein n=1 Tax=Adiantum capillus-veneris TaxID=13818 RepID=A0A9D4ZED6_ADICA|nr:hypothetical protein GOP47_0013268 [Adiantum capillus-veneris]
MDYDSHMRAAMHSSLCNVVNYGENQVGSMMALMTTDQAADADQNRPHHSQHAQNHQTSHESHHHHQHNNDHRHQLNILHSNSLSTASPPPSSFTFYNAAIVEPYLQSALIQATHAFNQSHHAEAHPPIISGLDHLEPSTVIPTEEEKPDIGASKVVQSSQFVGGRDCNYVIATTGPSLLVSPGANSTTQQSRAAAGTVSMDMENTHSHSHSSADYTDPVKAKIVSHPAYPRLVMAYVNCHKVGAPAEVVTSLEEVSKKYQTFTAASPAAMGADPELDHFMETYCNVLQKYHDELMQPYKEAMAFFRKIELQLNALSKGTLRLSQSGDEKGDGTGNHGQHHQNNNGSSSAEEEVEEEGDASCGEVDFHEEMIDPLAEDQKLKEQLLRKYSGFICSLKQEFLKKKKKGKLPKDARQKLLDWWSQHYKWPYPSETEKAALAESTGLDQKQINNWFINQRKRHWKPSEDMQYVMVDSPTAHHHHHHHVHTHPHAHLAAHPLSSYGVVETMDAAAAAAAATIMPALQ